MPYASRKLKPQVVFEIGQPVVLKLDTEPAEAKKGQKPGKAPFWTFFTSDDRVFWPRELLYSQLQTFKKGDVVQITRVSHDDWTVDTSTADITAVPKQTITNGGGLPVQKIMTKLKDLEDKLDQVLSKMNAEDKKAEEEISEEVSEDLF